MSNYVVEDGVNLWKLISIDDTDDTDDADNFCLITNNNLEKNFVTLPCGHKFNYKSLLNEFISLKEPNRYKRHKLKHGMSICPYCRQTHNGLLIHIPQEAGDKQIYGITTNSYKNAFPHRECEYTYKTGKNKGLLCQSKHAFITNDTTFCKKHRQIYLKQQDSLKLNETALNTCPFLTTNTCAQLRSFLKSINENTQGNKSELVLKVFSFTKKDSFT